MRYNSPRLHVRYVGGVSFDLKAVMIAWMLCLYVWLILTLNRHADDQEGPWPSRGAGQYTDEIFQTVRDPTSLSAQH